MALVEPASVPTLPNVTGGCAGISADGQIGSDQTTLDRMGLQPGQRVLEVGPGPGRLLIPAARRVLPAG